MSASPHSEDPVTDSDGAVPAAASDSKPRPAFVDQLQTILVAALLALAIRAFVIEPYRIPSESMLPTLLIGDHLFVNRFVYGIQIPFTQWRLPGLRAPRRGDVVVFSVARGGHGIHPADRRPDLPRDRFVKRLVGLPGDRIEVRPDRVIVNEVSVERVATGEPFQDADGRSLEIVREVLDGDAHLTLDDPRRPGPTGSFVVEPGRYFMMGDNRDDSNDSRRWGTVRFEELKGPAFVLYWSWNWNGSWGSLLSPLTWWDLFSERMRWDRIGARVR
jgi:signal peptidase I